MKYVARVRYPDGKDRHLRRLGHCKNLEEAWAKAQEMFPRGKIISVQISKESVAKLDKPLNDTV